MSKSIVLTVLASIVFAGAAFAGDGGEGDNQECNGQGNPNSPCGGAGGAGGEGGGGGGAGGDGGNGTANATAVATAVQGQTQGQTQGQAQGQGQEQKSSQSVTVEGDHAAASSAANLYLSNCTSGASAQGFGGGGSVGGPDEVCQLLNAALVGQQIGNAEFTNFAIERATALLKERTNFIIRFFQLFPVIRRVI